MTNDMSLITCWETQYRFNTFDLYVTTMRRMYIPPMGDTYQDINVCSSFSFEILLNKEGQEIEQTLEKELKNNNDS